jgi:hypothetical protein
LVRPSYGVSIDGDAAVGSQSGAIISIFRASGNAGHEGERVSTFRETEEGSPLRSSSSATIMHDHVFSHLEFEDTTVEDWLKMQEALGLSRGLHAQSMMYENNYDVALHGQCPFPDRLRAVVVPWSGITSSKS